MTGPWPTLLVRPDDAPGVGSGHVMRTLALVERWAATGPVVVALDEPTSPLADRVRAAGAQVAASAPTAEAAGLGPMLLAHRPAWVVLDGYGFGPDVQGSVRTAGTRLAVVDDHGHQGRYDADVILDQNLGVPPGALKERPDDAAALIGPRYALIREEFAAAATAEVEQQDAASGDAGAALPSVVVTLGGYAADRAEALADAVAEGLRPLGVTAAVTTPARAGATTAMAGLLAPATVVVSAAGTTAWELCALHRPSVLVAVAGNQELVGAALGDAGAARYLGVLDDVGTDAVVAAVAELLTDADARVRLALHAAALVDGRGAERVVTELRSSLVSLRPVGPDDRRLVWEWANDPAVRDAAWDRRPISWEDHCRWWEGEGAATRHHYLAEHAGRPWGQVRFDVDARGVAEVDVSVAEHCRGHRAAAPLIRAGVRRLFADTDAGTVRSSIRLVNRRSVAAFLAADFTPWPSAITGDGHVLTYVRGRDGRH